MLMRQRFTIFLSITLIIFTIYRHQTTDLQHHTNIQRATAVVASQIEPNEQEALNTYRAERRLEAVHRASRSRRVSLPRQTRSKPVQRHVGPLNWTALARCESGGNPRTNTGNGFYGLYQFDLQTWRGVGGKGLPSDASAQEQTYRAWLLYQDRGRKPWPVCGKYL
jgi:hypothetical protein